MVRSKDTSTPTSAISMVAVIINYVQVQVNTQKKLSYAKRNRTPA